MEDRIIVTVPKGFARLMLGGAALLCLVPAGFALAKMTVLVGRRRVYVEALMRRSEAFWTYIERNVDAS